MKNSSKLLLGLVLSVLAAGMAVPQATASHRQMGFGIWDTDEMWRQIHIQKPEPMEGPVRHHLALSIVLWPLMFYGADLNTYDTVTLNLTLRPDLTKGGSPAFLFAENCLMLENGVQQCRWRNVHLSLDEDGAILGAALRLEIDISVDWDTATGRYALDLHGIATAPYLTFEGETTLPVFVYAPVQQ